MNNTVLVNIKQNFDFSDSARGKLKAHELELAEGFVIYGKVALALQHMDVNGGLVVHSRGEKLRCRGRNSSVALNQLGKDAALGLDPHR